MGDARPRPRRGGRSRRRSGRCSAPPTTRSLPQPTSSKCSIGPPAEGLEAERVLVGVLGQVGVQADVEALGQLGGAPHQLGRDRERRARRQRDPHHRAPATGRGGRRRGRSRVGEDRRRRPARPSRAAGRRPSATGSSSPRVGWKRMPELAGGRDLGGDQVAAAASGGRRGGRSTSCTRRGPARPGRPTPTRTPPPRRGRPTAGTAW